MENKNNPLVSVIMTAYNREEYISEAIESVLNSTYKNFELIIVDDCSTDKTVEIAEKYAQSDPRVKLYVNEKNLTQFPNRNHSATYASGKYIKYFDSDDKLYDWALEYCVEKMEQYPDAALGLICNKKNVPPEYFLPEEAIPFNFFSEAILNIGPSGTILKRAAFENAGYYDADYGVPSDMYFNLKMASKFPVVLLKKDFFFYRIHDGQEFSNRYSYLRFNYNYLYDALEKLSLPLSIAQKEILLKKARRAFVRDFFIYIRNTGNLSKAIFAFRKSKITVAGFIKGLLNK